jgi:hypothetical protein
MSAFPPQAVFIAPSKEIANGLADHTRVIAHGMVKLLKASITLANHPLPPVISDLWELEPACPAHVQGKMDFGHVDIEYTRTLWTPAYKPGVGPSFAFPRTAIPVLLHAARAARHCRRWARASPAPWAATRSCSWIQRYPRCPSHTWR